MAQRLRYAQLAPEGMAALRSLEHYLNTGTGIDSVLLDLLRLRASVVNGCEFCVAAHTAELRRQNEPETRLEAVAAWERSEAFTPRERAALAWADAVTNVQDGHVDDRAFAAVSEFFEGKELADLTLAVASINAWNRMGIAFRAEWKPAGERAAAKEPAV